MSTTSKPTIVFCHGIWAGSSCFSKVIPALQADGHEVIAVNVCGWPTAKVSAVQRHVRS